MRGVRSANKKELAMSLLVAQKSQPHLHDSRNKSTVHDYAA